MPSFDAVVEPDLVELRNAVDQTAREIGTRFDFKGSSARVELSEKGAKALELTLHADADFQLAQVQDVLRQKLARRGVDARFVAFDARPETIGGDRLRQVCAVQSGIPAEAAKKMQSLLKASRLKVQGAIQGDVLRVSGAKRDDLQAAIALLRKDMPELPLAFRNFRE